MKTKNVPKDLVVPEVLFKQQQDAIIRLRVRGDLMKPTLQDRAIVGVDTSIMKQPCPIIGGDMYAVQFVPEVYEVRRICSYCKGGAWGLFFWGDNHKESRELFIPEEKDPLSFIIGRVICSFQVYDHDSSLFRWK